MSILDLPIELVLIVLSYLSRKDLLQFCNLNKSTRGLLNEEKLWLSKIRKLDKLVEYIDTLPYPTWKIVMTIERVKICRELITYYARVDNSKSYDKDKKSGTVEYIHKHLYNRKQRLRVRGVLKEVDVRHRSGSMKYLVKQGKVMVGGRKLIIKGGSVEYSNETNNIELSSYGGRVYITIPSIQGYFNAESIAYKLSDVKHPVCTYC